ncbi:hypothetical protein BV22DRAFT_1135799 [Leucogyrophana mollusca]|uniref:Uncharacterized protein n=1 Tax=Leucogyrophana mollusca TaxID=85980 RepID=A0ACB8AX48_9AGAM|nr:hypothetical protein BV22DRAFT_1135799 [Leucogyrophana mollusca]
MARPTIHKTPEARLMAAREKRRRSYAKEVINARRRKQCEPGSVRKQAKKPAVLLDTQARGAVSSEDLLVDENDSDDSDDMTLAQCLAIVKEAKDDLIALTGAPRSFVEGVLQEFVATMDCESSDNSDGDLNILDRALASIETIHDKAHKGQDKIYEMCGLCVEWHAADVVCKGIRNVVAMLEDIYCLAMQGGAELAEAHMLGELMYQKYDHSSLT